MAENKRVAFAGYPETLYTQGPGRQRRWSIPTEGLASEVRRLGVEIDPDENGLIDIFDACMTSNHPEAEKCVPYETIPLTRAEALWLIDVLAAAVVARDVLMDEADAEAAKGPVDESGR